MRRGRAAPPTIARAGDEAPLELEVRVPPGQEEVAERELRAAGAEVGARRRGELRVTPGGPVRPILELERPLAYYAVRALPGLSLERADAPAALAAALELAAVVANLGFKGRLATYRLTAAPELVGDRRAVARLSGAIGRRLGLAPVVVGPELILILRPAPGGLEMAARLPTLGGRAER